MKLPGLLLAALAGTLTATTTAAAAPAAPPYDLIVENGRVVDGTGSPWMAGDVGIRGGRIAAVGHLGGAPAARRIDAAGRVVAPGFIDMLGQSELTILVEPRLPSKIFQGITTEVTGEGARRRRSTTRSSPPTSSATSTWASGPTGGRSASTSPASSGRRSASTSRPTSGRPRCGG